ncbi:MAG: hypothetical protein IJ218_06755 [Alphaproteobacteria bacterium]|nr:hypothetical protein [Alphaproteobacteria bacterium]
MKQNLKAIYALSAALVATMAANIATADSDLGAKPYTPQAVTRPQPLAPAPTPVYVKEQAQLVETQAEAPKPEVVYYSAPDVPYAEPVRAMPQPIFLTSPVPPAVPNDSNKSGQKNCGCKKCNSGCNNIQPVAAPIVVAEPTPMPCQTCTQPAPVVIEEPVVEAQPAPCATGNCPQLQPLMVVEPEPKPVVAPCDSAKGECNRVPPADKDGSLFPGGKCSNCAGGKAPATQVAEAPCNAANGECNHVPPADKDGSLFPGGKCRNCAGGKAPVAQETEAPCTECAQVQSNVPYTISIYQSMQHNCCQMASIALDHVDFRLADKGSSGLYSNRIGAYRFRIFGCRRMNKDARLNSGRILEKNINFQSAFANAVDSCYKVLPAPRDLCLQAVPTELPEYVLTAEITDYFMNICDEYDWGKAEKKEQRSGNSEITVTWRLMDLTKNIVYWKGETSGYGEIYEGEPEGETKLIERAFADAASNLRAMTGFEDQLLQRVPDQTISAQRWALIEEERALNPIKCGYRKEYECSNSCVINGPQSDISKCLPTCGCATGTCGQVEYVEPTPAPEPITAPCGTIVNAEGVKVPAPCETGAVKVEPLKVKTEPQPIPVQVTAATCYDEHGSFVESATCRRVDDTWIDTGDVTALDTLCINTTDPCQKLTQEEVYRLRASVVQIESPNGRKGAGLLISDRFILTSGDLVDRGAYSYKVKTIRNAEYTARAVRLNPQKNTALLMLDSSVEYSPLALNLNLPEVNSGGFLTLGLLDVVDFKNGEDYLENKAKIAGYRYTEDKGAEILVNTFIQNVTVGGALFDQNCTISGMAHSGIRTNDGMDVYVPTETALRSLGISICGHEYTAPSPWQQTIYKPLTQQITVIPQAPEVMPVKDRK